MSVFYNNKIYSSEENLFSVANRAFRYGDGIFETMVAMNGKIKLWKLHSDRLQKAAAAFHLQLNDEKIYTNAIENILNNFFKNREKKIARVRLFIWRNSEGSYQPTIDETDFAIEIAEAEMTGDDVKIMGIFSDILKPKSPLANYKSLNSSLYVLAGIACRERNWDDCVTLNENKKICEALYSNIFFVKENKIFTPAISELCIDGVMRRWIIKTLFEYGFELIEGSFAVDEILNADEVFISNALQGVRSVRNINDKIFSQKNTAQKIKELYSEFLKE